MINLGAPEVRVDADGWTVRTADGKLSAQFEHTVLVTATGHEILTRLATAEEPRSATGRVAIPRFLGQGR